MSAAVLASLISLQTLFFSQWILSVRSEAFEYHRSLVLEVTALILSIMTLIGDKEKD